MKEKMFAGDAAKWLVEAIGRRGLPTESVLAGTGLDQNWLDEPLAVLTASQYIQLVRNALRESRDPALGLSAADQSNYISRFDFWGYAILSSANWGQASRIAIKYWDVSGSLVRLELSEQGENYRWDIFPACDFQDEAVLIFAVEKFLSSSVATMVFALGERPPIREITLSYPPPAHATRYQELFNARVLFNQPMNAVVMSREIMEAPLLMANPQVAEVCQQQCAEVLSNLRESDALVDRIRKVIIESPGQFPQAKQVAQTLGVSPRTLRRRLEALGTSYTQVTEEIRVGLASSYLATTNIHIDEIAQLMGYAETTTFRHAFKKWTGRSAASVRKSGAIR